MWLCVRFTCTACELCHRWCRHLLRACLSCLYLCNKFKAHLLIAALMQRKQDCVSQSETVASSAQEICCACGRYGSSSFFFLFFLCLLPGALCGFGCGATGAWFPLLLLLKMNWNLNHVRHVMHPFLVIYICTVIYIHIFTTYIYWRKFRSQTSDNMDRWKSRGGKSQRREEKKKEDRRRERNCRTMESSSKNSKSNSKSSQSKRPRSEQPDTQSTHKW